MIRELDRRSFLGLATAGFGAATLKAASFTVPNMNSRILVAYATRCGSTLEIAQAVARDLKSRGYAADLRPAEKVYGLSGYRAVVVGSAVRFGRWLPEAVEFVRRSQAELKRLPTAFFTVHGQNVGSDEVSRKNRLAYIDPVRAMVRPGAEVFFAGKVDSSRMSFGARLVFKMMKARDCDLRDWHLIHAWAQSIFPEVPKA